MPKKRVDGQITGLAGEFFVAAELLKHDLQTSVTFGNAKAIDLLAVHSETGRVFKVQVKALREKNYFLIKPTSVKRDHIYVFVLLNKPGKPVEYYIVPGAVLIDEAARFGNAFTGEMSGIHPRDLTEFKDKWQTFERLAVEAAGSTPSPTAAGIGLIGGAAQDRHFSPSCPNPLVLNRHPSTPSARERIAAVLALLPSSTQEEQAGSRGQKARALYLSRLTLKGERMPGKVDRLQRTLTRIVRRLV